MSWTHYKEVVTVTDVFARGSCYKGVVDWIKANDYIISVNPLKYLHVSAIRFASDRDRYGFGTAYGESQRTGCGDYGCPNEDGDGESYTGMYSDYPGVNDGGGGGWSSSLGAKNIGWETGSDYSEPYGVI